MTALGLIGIILGLASWRVAFVRGTDTRVFVFIAAAVAHISSSLIYYQYVQHNPADTTLYYYDRLGFYGQGFEFGTEAVIYIVQFSKEWVGGTYLDYFLLFQAISFWGIAFLMRTIEEMYIDLRMEQPSTSYLVIFLPGLHFWTSAIGKDAPLLLASSLVVWAAMRLSTRYFAFIVALSIMVVFRTQIALVALVTLAISAAFFPRASLPSRLLLGLLGTSGVVFGALTFQSSLGFDITNAESVFSFVENQSDLSSEGVRGTDVTGAPYLVRLISLLFRPFFFDITGPFALVASFENAFIAYILFALGWHYRLTAVLIKNVFFLRFSFIFVVTCALSLALVYYNVGLGLRHKMMLMPALLIFFSALVAVRRSSTRPVAMQSA